MNMMGKKLNLYLYSQEVAEKLNDEGSSLREVCFNGSHVELYDCGTKGERYEQALKLLDGDEEAIETVFIDRQEKPDLELGSFLLDHGFKIGLIVKDPEDNKKVHSSSYVYKADDLMKALEEYGGNLAFASDFPERLKQDILAVVTENKDNARRLRMQIARCATFAPLNAYRDEHPYVTDDNVFVARVRHVELEEMAHFEIELADDEKFDKKKLKLLTFEWFYPNLQPKGKLGEGYREAMVPLILYGNTLYEGFLSDWVSDESYFGLFKVKKETDTRSYNVEGAGIGQPLAEGRKYFVTEAPLEKQKYTGEESFRGRENLVSIEIVDSVTVIKGQTFCDCKGLTSVVIPASVTSIEWAAFYGCSALSSVTIEGPVTTIGRMAFANCSSLKMLTLPAGIKKIDKTAFDNCTSLKTINVPAKKADYYKKRLPESFHHLIVELPPVKKAKK